jgi:pimeloyl-ACP methyl ester carboxylesterase
VIPPLTSAGHRVLAPSLTGYGDKRHLAGPEVGLDTHVDDIVRLVTDEDLTDVVLVGHSYAGLVISSAANQVPERIAHLVYLDAMVPEDGETAADVLPVTRDLIDLALNSESGWRVPPRCHRPSACSGSPTRRTSRGCARCCRTSRCAASNSRSAWTTRP